MNKIYRVVWNASVGAWVAVAETAKSKTKSRSKKAGVMGAGLALAGAMAFGSSAFAAPGNGSIDTAATCGTNAQRTLAGDVAIGCGSVAAGSNSIAIGGTATTATPSGTPSNPITQGTQSIAIGFDAQVQGDQSIGLGANVRATGNSSIAIGGDDLNKVVGTTAATKYNQLTGDTILLNDYRNTTSGTAAVAVGIQSQATGDLSTAFGTRTQATGSSATALGVGASATKDGAVALGAGSLTDGVATKVEDATVNGVNFIGFTGAAGFAGANDSGRQVSVGSAGFERQIKNVAPGEISATSTDAINGSQIYAVTDKLIDNIKGATNTAPVVYTKADGTQVYKVGTDFFENAAGTGTAVAPTDIITSVRNANGSTTTATKLSNIAAGSIAAGSTDAINGSQLNATNTKVANNTTALGGSYDAVTGAYTAPVYNVVANPSSATTTPFTTVKGAVEQLSGAVQTPLTFAGDSGLAVKRKLGEELKLRGGATATDLSDNNIGVVANGTDTLTIKLSKTLTGLTSAQYVDALNPANVSTITAAGTNVTDGTNTSNYGANGFTATDAAGTNGITVNNGGVSFTDNLGAATGPVITAAGIDAGNKKITGLIDGTLATDAATVGQVDALGDSAVQYDRNQNGSVNKNSVSLKGIAATSIQAIDGRITTTAGTSLNNVASAGDYTNVANASKGINAGDLNNAVLDASGNVQDIIGGTTTVNADGSITNNNIGGTGATTIDGAIATNTSDIADLATGKAGLVQQANGAAPITVGKDSLGTQVNFTNANGFDRQLTGVASGNVSATSTDAINGGQIYGLVGAKAYKDASGNTTSSIQNIGGTGTTNINDAIASVNSATTKAKTTVSEGDNIVITTTTNTDGSTDYEVATSKNLAVDSITAADGAGNVTNLTATGTNVTNGANTSNYGANGFTATDAAGNNGITVNNSGVSFTDNLGAATGPRITAGGIDAGDTAIINVADAVNATDAVNKGQLDALGDSAVQYDRNQNGSVNYNQVTLAGTPAVLGVNADGKSIVVSGGTTLSNVANGAIASDAVNKGQLDSAISANITDVVVTDANGNPITVNVTEQVVNTNLNNDPNSLFLTYNVEGQNFTDRLTIGETVQKMNTEGVKFAHTNAVAAPLAGASTNDSSAGGDNSTAIGVNAIITQNGESSVALGHNTRVEGASSIAIGNGSQANGNQSIAIGTGNIVNGDNSGAFGDPSIINGSNSYSVGNNNTLSTNDTFVLGNNVTATVDGSVVLGTGSGATTGAGVAGYGSVGNAAIIATTSTTGAVAVGNGTNVFRQITGLAAGTQDSDAVNVAQLKAVDNALTNLTNGGAGLVQQAGNNAVITVGAATGGTSVNFAGTDGNRQLIGVAAGTANNHAANVGQITSALGNQATVGADGKINANLNVGGASYGNVQDALSAVNGQVGQLSDAAVQYDKNPDSTVNKGKITLGGGANGTTLTNVKDGVLSAGSKDAVNGGQLFETNQQVNNLANQISSGSVGLVQQAGDKAQVTVAANTGGTSVSMAGTDGNRTVTGVKAGAVSATSKEAVNGAQLHAANSNVASALGGGSKVDADGNVTAPVYEVAGGTHNNVGSALAAVDNASTTRFDALNNKFDQAFYYTNERISKVEKQANAGIAAALSLESAPFVPGKFTYSVGAGFHGGENAVGATLRRTSDSGRWSLTGGVAAASEGGASARVGISGIID